jgi:holo-ACP synthase/triphosphoribosyl-dephospho-CoA synthase
MDIFTFMASTAALQSYFGDCAKIGMETRALSPTEVFGKIRLRGMLAEGDMLRQTAGVNTHKGAVFTMGLACAAAGRLEAFSCDGLLAQCAAMTDGLTAGDFRHVTPASARTAGEKLYAQYGITGIRGQAEAGFPAVKDFGLPVLEKGLAEGLSFDRAGAAALLAILAHTDDTNLISRSDREIQQTTAQFVAELLKKDPYPRWETLADLDRQFIEKHLSPGGSADLLALTLFVHFLSQRNEEEIL